MHSKNLPQKNITDTLKIGKLLVNFDLFYPAKSLYFPHLARFLKDSFVLTECVHCARP